MAADRATRVSDTNINVISILTQATNAAIRIIRRKTRLHPRNAQIAQTVSGVSFARDLKGQLSHDGSRRLQSDSWNLGVRLNDASDPLPLTELLTKLDAQRFSNLFFQKIHPIYCIVSQDRFEDQLNQRWSGGSSSVYDAVLCGVIALGSLFSGACASPKETIIMEKAKVVLETSSPTSSSPAFPLDLATAWILLTLYSRMAVEPHAAWVASRMAVQVMTEHRRPPQNVPVRETRDQNTQSHAGVADDHSPVDESRLYWVASALNVWICSEYGLSQAEAEASSRICQPPPLTPRHSNDLTPLVMKLYQISLQFPRGHSREMSPSDLLGILHDISTFLPPEPHDVLLLHKGNHAFCLYRTLRSTTSPIPPPVLSQIIAFGAAGLHAALRLAQDQQPWWHVANVPFQFLCVLLAMDTRESLAQVEEAMQALRQIAQCFNTSKMQRVVATAEGLVKLSQKNKLEDARMLGGLFVTTNDDQSTTNRSPGGATDNDGRMGDLTPEPSPFPQPDRLARDTNHNTHSNFDAGQISNDTLAQVEFSDPFDWDEFLNTEFPNEFT